MMNQFISLIVLFLTFSCHQETKTQEQEQPNHSEVVSFSEESIPKTDQYLISNQDQPTFSQEETTTKRINSDALYFLDILDNKKLYEIRNAFSAEYKRTLIEYYNQFVFCSIADDLLKDHKDLAISKEEMIQFIEKNLDAWHYDLTELSTEELTERHKSLVSLRFDEFERQMKIRNYGNSLSYDLIRLDNHAYMLLINAGSMSSSQNYTMLTDKNYSYGKFYSYNYDKYLQDEIGWLTRKINENCTSRFYKFGATATNIKGLSYYEIPFSKESDPGCCPSLIVAVPAFTEQDRLALPTYFRYAENDVVWKTLTPQEKP